ncbi:methylmalonyl-CoA mutase [Amycolatopsis acidicola]|uniref:Methylmalonyl-CoA mutase n=1 Tax=Amycolatopsis acidicola TaxID=2596893 RepID=A0A5N0VGE8_9PSEU|nr:methylmalonyl-CoA mutase [Amycolatopsis acidicola]
MTGPGGKTIIPPVSLKLSRTTTWSDIETKPVYKPEDTTGTYEEKLGNPGEYPFTRGSFPQMYRSRMWTLRNIVGYGTAADTREGIEMARRAGQAGFNVVLDTVSGIGVDPDHPALEAEVGLDGCSIGHLDDLDVLFDGIDPTETDVAWHATHNIYPLMVAFAKQKGYDLAKLQGSHMPDYLKYNLDGGGEKFMSPELSHRMAIDTVEYAVRNTPKWALGYPQVYNIRERGITPATEIALGLAIAATTFQDLAERGLSVDEIAPSMAWVSTSDIDFFEEVAKFRALRRMWARMVKERFGGTNPRAMRLRIAVHTSGRSLVYQQPLNNLTRTAIETLAALAGGVQSVETCTYDEPVSIPTHEARELSIRQQLILAHEVGAARTADPLGGSYYVEWLTDKLEEDALAIQVKLEEKGIVKSVEDGSFEALMDEYNLKRQEEIDNGERILIGVNAFVPESEPEPQRFTFDGAPVKDYVQEFRAKKARRDLPRLVARMRDVFDSVRDGRNTQPAMVEAFLAGATVGEMSGVLRQASGMQYDPYLVLESPFDFERARYLEHV